MSIFWGAYQTPVLLSLILILLPCIRLKAEPATPADASSFSLLQQNSEISRIIAEKDPEHFVQFSFEHSNKEYLPESYRMDPSVYVIEYPAELILSSRESLNTAKPTVYIPIFSTINGAERVVGHAKLSYRYEENDYQISCGWKNFQDADFINGENAHFLEKIYSPSKISKLTESLKTDKIQNMILLSESYAVNDMSGKILLIETLSDSYVLDYTNVFHSSEKNEALYKISEYSVFRQDYEKAAHSGGIFKLWGLFLKKYWAALLLALLLIAGSAVYAIGKMRRKTW